MEYIFSDILLSKKQNVRSALIKIYGIGYQRANYLCDLLGFNLIYKLGKVDKKQFLVLIWLIMDSFLVEEYLRKRKILSLRAIKESNSIKGIRHKYFLPTRGQRTHSNARTRKKLRPIKNKLKSKKSKKNK